MAAKSSLIILPTKIDPYAEFISRVKKAVDLTGVRLFPTDVICAHVIVDRSSTGNILLPDVNKNEQRWQGKVGLVIMLGDDAFKDSDTAKFCGFKANIGEFVVYRNSDGHDFDYIQTDGKPVACRRVTDSDIKMVIPRPDMIY